MNERKLTEEEINDLFTFCELHGVYYYDVQVELVDHLACAIEEKWEDNSFLSFKDALSSVFRGFGIYGFSKIKQVKEKELKRKYFILRNQYIREFFQLPKIILTIVITLILFLLFRLSADKVITYLILTGIYFVVLSAYLFVFYPKRYNMRLKEKKKLLMLDYFNSMKGNIYVYGMLPLNLFTIFGISITRFKFQMPFSGSAISDLVLAFLMTLFGISMVAMATYIPARIKNDIIRQYSQIILS